MKNQTPTYGNDVEAQMQQGQEIPPQAAPTIGWRRPVRRRKQSGSFLQLLQNVNIAQALTIQQARTLPNWLVGRSLAFFFIAFLACTVVWGYPMEIQLAVIASISVLLFFYGCKLATQKWSSVSERTFLRNVFVLGFVVRLAWVLYCYYFFNPEYYGTTYGETADTTWYMPFGEAIAEWVRGNEQISFEQLRKTWGSAIDDIGYPIWLAVLNLITFGRSDVLMPFIVKSFVGAYCAVCIYNVTNRHFGDGTARLAALFVCLNPNIIYWCGSMFKEAEMVFLCCLCVDLVDKAFTSVNKLTFKSLIPGVLVGSYLFFFRSALAVVIFLAMFAHIVLVSQRVMNTGKKIIAGVLVAGTLLVGMGDRIMSQAGDLFERAQSDSQSKNMEWRSRRSGGNDFAKYAGAAVFAPLIFTIPFPTFNIANEGQILQRQLAGGSYIKNIFSFFVIMVLLSMLLSGEWRRHVFILAYTCGYLLTLVLSSFAQSGRFHMPIWPMLMLFAAYGIQVAKVNVRLKRWFTVALCLEVVICLAWNWFKLAGRGMI